MQISTRLILSSFAVAAVIAVSFWLLSPMVALISIAFGMTMLAITIIDARHFIIPDVLSLPSIPAGVLVTGLLAWDGYRYDRMLESCLALLFAALALLLIRESYSLLRKREGLGLGDVKLASVAGAWTGFTGLPAVLLLACFLAISSILIAYFRNRQAVTGATRIPFGAYLAPSIWVIWLHQAASLDLGPAFI